MEGLTNKTKEIMERGIICWWSGGITSAVACRLAIDLFGGVTAG